MNKPYLASEDTLSEIRIQSHSDNVLGVFIFKHSTRCSISSMALRRFLEAMENIQTPYYILLVIENRILSNVVAEMFSVIHQSPQVLWIKNGECIKNTSHSEITSRWLLECIKR
ncbi:MAG: bacillithiol system redox-active protein YtxJ [Flavobacteriales bacterium]|nr:bacillithiol system redox-active protein YtxJ [Flavobacteriales bacterium]